VRTLADDLWTLARHCLTALLVSMFIVIGVFIGNQAGIDIAAACCRIRGERSIARVVAPDALPEGVRQ
jgi:hypothetical protein